MDIRHIEHFLQLVKYEHMSQTADFLNITQPTLSKSIALLEAEIGTKLFDRTGNRIHLNQNGKKYLQYAEKAIELLNTGKLAANNIDNSIHGEIYFQNRIYPRIITSCALAYAKINPYVTFSHITPDQDVEPSFIFTSTLNTHTLPQEKIWISQPLFEETFYLIASPRYMKAELFHTEGDSIALETMKDEYFVAYESKDILVRDITHTLCQEAGFYPKVFYKTNNFYLKMHIIDEGFSLGIIPECCLDDAKKLSPDIQIFRLKDLNYSRTVYVRRKRDGLATDITKDFWEFMLDYFNVKEEDRVKG